LIIYTLFQPKYTPDKVYIARYTQAPFMKLLGFLFFLVACSPTFASLPEPEKQSSDEQQCLNYVRLGENYKFAHQNEHCLSAANAGVASVQYSVGMGYGFAGDSASEEKYYRMAANNRNIAAYLGLGHVLAKSKPWEAIYWYQRYIATRHDGWGYAAILVSRIFNRLGDPAQAAYWLDACRSSTYEGCNE
jgi:hypothetical protein